MKDNYKLSLHRIFFALLFVLFIGCDECTEFSQFCNGNAVRTCTWMGTEYQWKEVDCSSRHCTEVVSVYGDDETICTLEPQPEPACLETDSQHDVYTRCRGSAPAWLQPRLDRWVAIRKLHHRINADMHTLLFGIRNPPRCLDR